MQTRMALIIGASDQSIPGVSIDVDRMHSFLLSPIGGFWKENEVDRLISPSIENLQKKIHNLKYFDYAIIYFAGHGYYSSDSNQTIVQINDKENFKTHDFRHGAKKQTIILDCCRRSINDRNLRKSIIKEAAFDSANNIKINPVLCRFFFDQEIKYCDDGLNIMNACAINETASENSNEGGYYTSSLITSAENWAMKNLVASKNSARGFSLSTWDCHSFATKKVDSLSGGRQNPTFDSPRLIKKFPFAVVA